ncbi:hypothetical protein FKW15_08110 [Acetobacter sp. DmW_125133]|nr:hypothetical protein FKW19_13460 [Acetobacter sp. DmW_125128]KAA8396824.1 hypothetical protein FKW20_10055 [Acetobacter sp. DmW_125127]KAA8398781.1 hypothetical protein FKW22_02990 [Acetobacter sp. DmW_125124]KAA8405185.1 hypothetical protein FKW15_08110 [Acetobacter sp. DmW_125133]KAA8405675.1 hypothetical protein FKW32_05590 [Acetobacter sp. DmW_125132]KAA8409318.1 hypothetical protein FKW24_03600 [Acetobacter sp. DmW_125134]KAA8411068.1 hypothetical protein FKW18_10855 [Acetobacter sp. 
MRGKTTVVERKTYQNVVGYLVAFVVLTLLYTALGMTQPLNSDSVSTLLAAQDILHGNVLLKGWDLSTQSFYFTEILPYVVVFGLFGWHVSFYYIVPAMLWAVAMLLAFRIVRSATCIVGWPLLVLLGAPSAFAIHLVLSPCYHVGAYVGMLLFWLMWLRKPQWLQSKSLFAICTRWSGTVLFVALLLSSDDLVKYTLALPIILAAIGCSLEQRGPRYCGIASSMVGALLLEHVIKTVLAHNGAFHVPGLWSSSFGSQSRASYNLSVLFSGFLQYFGADFFGKPITLSGSGRELFHLMCAGGTVWCCFHVLRKNRQWTLFDLSAALAILIMLAAFIFGELTMDEQSFRYLVFPCLLSVLLVVRHVQVPRGYGFLFGGCCILYAATILPRPVLGYAAANQNFPVNHALEQMGLKQGFAPYWSAARNSLPFQARLAPIEFTPSGIKAFHTLSKRQWYETGGNFIVCESADQAAQAQTQFGPAQKEIRIGSNMLLVWSHPFKVPEN